MPVLSYVHHLFNADTCQSYLHTLRWKDRPLQCPRCQSHHVGPWGTYGVDNLTVPLYRFTTLWHTRAIPASSPE